MADSEGTLLPYVYEIDDVKRYWCDYYEMDDRQVKLVEELFNERRNNASVVISDEIISELKKLYGDNVALCIDALNEIGFITEK